jgi:hypothetical protein
VDTPDLDPVRRIVARDHGLASVSVVRADGTPHTSLVNAGVLDHPLRSVDPKFRLSMAVATTVDNR